MSYTTDDQSPSGASPVELYTFEGPGRSYRYTSHFEDVVYNTDTYTAVPMARSSLLSAADDDLPTLSVDLPIDLAFVQDYAFKVSPSWSTVLIRRYHLASGPAVGVTYFTGDVTGVRVRGRVATVEATVAAHRLDAPVPGIAWQNTCNHALYNARCGVLQSNHQVPASGVISIDTTGTIITVSHIDGIPALGGASTPEDYLAGGTLTRVADGESRLILANNGLNNATITIARPFADLGVLDSVRLSAGCDLARATCHDRFGNVERFGGHPSMPLTSLFGSNFSERY